MKVFTSIALVVLFLTANISLASDQNDTKNFSDSYKEKLENNSKREPKLTKKHLEFLDRVDKLAR